MFLIFSIVCLFSISLISVFSCIYFLLVSFTMSFLSLILFFFLNSLLEYNCFTLLCQFLLYNKVNQLYVYIYPHIPSLLCLPPTLPIPALWVVSKHGADLPVLCGCFPLAICFTFGSVYMSVPLSLRPSLPFPLPVSSSPFSTSASLFLSCPQVLQNHCFFLRFRIYVLAYGICFSLSDLLHSI